MVTVEQIVIKCVQKKLETIVTNLKIDNQLIEKVDNTTFIGVMLDSHLSWSKQIKMVKKKIARGIGIINKARK